MLTPSHVLTLVLVCPNSDGLSNFMFNHEGYWRYGGSGVGLKDTAVECANDCIQDDKCVAINYHHSGSQKGVCWHYKNIANLNKASEKAHSIAQAQLSKAYMRCPGIKIYKYYNNCI